MYDKKSLELCFYNEPASRQMENAQATAESALTAGSADTYAPIYFIAVGH